MRMIVYLILINAAGLVIMLLDKQFARARRRRIPERTILLCALLGGSLGCCLGMALFRHKTKHRKFSTGLPVILAMQVLIGGIYWIFR